MAMLQALQTSEEYFALRENYRNNLSPEEQARFDHLYESLGVERLDNLDGDQLNEILTPLYADRGAPAKNQRQTFNSYYLFINSDYISLTAWVKTVKSDPHLKVLAGVEPDGNFPSLGSHYNFVDRLAKDCPKSGHVAPKGKNNKRPKKPKKGQKAEDPSPDLKTEQIAQGILEDENFMSEDARVFNRLLCELGVLPSQSCGIMPEELSLSGDGTNLPVKSSPYGHRRKDLDKNLRYYGAPDASWGWDSSKNCFFYGYNLYTYTYYDPERRFELPVGFDLFGAAEHDSTASLKTLSGLFESLPLSEVRRLVFDSAHDGNATYKLCLELGIEAFIDINPRVSKPEKERGFDFSDLGIPICKNGREMKYDGYSPKRADCKWICPLKQNETCPLRCRKTPSVPTFYTRPSKNPRFFTITPRNSRKFKKIYNTRSASERINKRLLKDHDLEAYGFKSRRMILFLTALSGIDLHMQVQIEQAAEDRRAA